jgi:ATP-binding cassette subfamily C protein
MTSYPCVQQHDQEDCGAACLSAITTYHGQPVALSKVRELVGTGTQGTTLLGLKQGADRLGFNARSIQATPEIMQHLEAVPLPMIIHWQGMHWVVLYGRKGRRYVIADPAVGVRHLSVGQRVGRRLG